MIKKVSKNVGAIVVGLLVIVLLSIVTDFILELLGIFPSAAHPELYSQWMLAVALLYRLMFAVIGGYITAKIASAETMAPVLMLAFIGFIIGTLGTMANWDKTTPGTEWYPILLIILSIPAVWLGGHFKRSFI